MAFVIHIKTTPHTGLWSNLLRKKAFTTIFMKIGFENSITKLKFLCCLADMKTAWKNLCWLLLTIWSAALLWKQPCSIFLISLLNLWSVLAAWIFFYYDLLNNSYGDIPLLYNFISSVCQRIMELSFLCGFFDSWSNPVTSYRIFSNKHWVSNKCRTFGYPHRNKPLPLISAFPLISAAPLNTVLIRIVTIFY